MSSTASSSRPHWQADATLALVALVWGTTFVMVKGALHEISTLLFLTLRFALAATCMAPLLSSALRGGGVRATLLGLRAGLITGLLLALGYVLQTFGLLYTSAGNSGFLTGLYIVLVPLLSAAIYRRWPRWPELLGVAIAGAGMVLLTLPGLRQNFTINFGDLLTIGCAIAFSGHMLVLGYYSKRHRVEAVAFGQVFGVALLCGAALPLEPSVVHWTPAVFVAICVTGVFATALAFVLQTWGQRHTSATRAAVVFSLEPVFALVTAVAVGGERLTLSGVCGGILILAGILLVELKGAR